MSWKFVFNGSLARMTFGTAKEMSKKCGYNFFTFTLNDEVYYNDGNKIGIKVKDLF